MSCCADWPDFPTFSRYRHGALPCRVRERDQLAQQLLHAKWLNGIGSGSSLHFNFVLDVLPRGEAIWIVEGFLKADAISALRPNTAIIATWQRKAKGIDDVALLGLPIEQISYADCSRSHPWTKSGSRDEDGSTFEYCIYSPHSLRATVGAILLDAGEGIRKVQDLLGYKHVTATQIHDKRPIAASQSASHNVPF